MKCSPTVYAAYLVSQLTSSLYSPYTQQSGGLPQPLLKRLDFSANLPNILSADEEKNTVYGDRVTARFKAGKNTRTIATKEIG